MNTIRGLALDPQTLRPRLARATGGYSGPALKPVALACVYACAAAVDVPIVGMGGVGPGSTRSSSSRPERAPSRSARSSSPIRARRPGSGRELDAEARHGGSDEARRRPRNRARASTVLPR